jgi:hypothetical protein
VCLNGNFKVEITHLLIPYHYIIVYTMVKLAPAQEKGKSPSYSENNVLMNPELDSAVLAYLVGRGLTRSVKAFEGETKAKIATAGVLESAWLAGSSKA